MEKMVCALVARDQIAARRGKLPQLGSAVPLGNRRTQVLSFELTVAFDSTAYSLDNLPAMSASIEALPAP